MARFKCPHCSAVNQDVAESDPCWQCGVVLNSEPAAAETKSDQNARQSSAVPNREMAAQRVRKRVEERDRRAPAPAWLSTPVVIGGMVVLAFIIAVVVVILLSKIGH